MNMRQAGPETGHNGPPGISERERKRLQNALARRKLERLREEKALKRWLSDVWDDPCDSN